MKNTALLIVDVQVGLIEAPRHAYRGGEVVERINSLITKARSSGTPVIYMQHDGGDESPVRVGSAGWEIHPEIAPAGGEPVFRKRASDSFHETPLHEELARRGVERLLVTGCRTDYCVDTTVRRAITLGYDVTLVKDAHTTVDNGVLSAAQIIEHHNRTLDDFGTDEHVVNVRDSEEISFD
jgi:nicotinamidase-related amidase